jgi:hypothetical protein
MLTILMMAACLTTAVETAADASRLTRIQINRAMALPGVILPPGRYTFEVANPSTSANTVLVTSGDAHRTVHFLGLAARVERPRRMPADQVISVGEAPDGEPIPILAWYPAGFSTGYRFNY